MEVNQVEHKIDKIHTDFRYLKAGDIFSFSDEIYMKLDREDPYDYNVVHLKSGVVSNMSTCADVVEIVGDMTWDFKVKE
jgi:hypothetical protein